MQKLTLNKETIRNLDEKALDQVHAGANTMNGMCIMTKSCFTRMGCKTEILC